MSGIPDSPLRAVVDLHRCLEARDYAGAALLIRRPETRAGIADLAAVAAASLTDAAAARHQAAARQLGDAERARIQARVGPLLDELIGVLARALAEDERERRAGRAA